jgi:hypothetical protein
MLSPPRQTLVASAAIPLGVWAAAVPGIKAHFDRGYSSGFEHFAVVWTGVSVVLTIAALALVILSWRGKVRPLYAGLVSAVATMSIVVLSVVLNLPG